MTDETEQSETSQLDATSSPDDSRYEVKWKKKAGSSSTPPPQVVEAAKGETVQPAESDAGQRIRDLQDRLQRAQADLVNLRRRTEAEREDMEKFASMLLVQAILPVLDNFDRALQTIPGNLQMLTWIQGVMLIERHLRAILEQQGLAPLEAQGKPFDAYYHEAIAERETAEVPPGTVVAELQKGYTMHGRVIRPTLVEVAKAPAALEQEAAAPDAAEQAASEHSDGETIAEQVKTENVGP